MEPNDQTAPELCVIFRFYCFEDFMNTYLLGKHFPKPFQMDTSDDVFQPAPRGRGRPRGRRQDNQPSPLTRTPSGSTSSKPR